MSKKLLNLALVLCSLLNGAEELNLKKKLEDRYGGQLREFFTDDAHMYEGIESPATFFTSQERQHITLHLLNNIRVKTPHECIQGHRFIRGQAIGKESTHSSLSIVVTHSLLVTRVHFSPTTAIEKVKSLLSPYSA